MLTIFARGKLFWVCFDLANNLCHVHILERHDKTYTVCFLSSHGCDAKQKITFPYDEDHDDYKDDDGDHEDDENGDHDDDDSDDNTYH